LGSLSRLGEDLVVFGFPLSGLVSSNGNLTTGNLTALQGWKTTQVNSRCPRRYSLATAADRSSTAPAICRSGRRHLDALLVADATEDIPQNVNFAIKASIVENFLQASSVDFVRSTENAVKSTADVAEVARRATVRIECTH
jgi:hypothetical protein